MCTVGARYTDGVVGRHLLERRHTPLLLLAVLVAATALTTYVRRQPPPPTRVAIRVTCPDASTCAFIAQELALDVWSEQQVSDLVLDVVVARATLALLDEARVRWRIARFAG